MRIYVLVWGVVVGGCGSNDVPATVLPSCQSYEHKVGDKCVPNVFDDVTIAPPPTAAQIDVDAAGVKYIRGQLFVALKDPSGDGKALAAKYGAQVIGAIPFAGLYHVSFADATTSSALDAKAAALAADATVESVTRDFALPRGPLDSRPRDTDYDKLTDASGYTDYALGTSAALGSTGRWAYGAVAAAWDELYAANPVTFPVVVSILDTPVASLTGIFAGLGLRGGHDLRPNTDVTPEQQKHGTAVASIIGAVNRGTGSANGILSGRSCIHYDLNPIAVTGSNPMGQPPVDGGDLYIDALFYGVVYAVQAGASVVNMSVGSSCMPGNTRFNLARNLRRVLERAPRTLFVIAAANDDVDAATAWPASAARTDELGYAGNVVTVAAHDEMGQKAKWFAPGRCDSDGKCLVASAPVLCTSPAAYGKTTMSCTSDGDCPSTQIGASNHVVSVPSAVTLAAPGVRELATLPDGRLTLFSGTSGAAPMVSGVAGLLFAIVPGLSGEQARDILISSADKATDGSIVRIMNPSSALATVIAYQVMLAPKLDGQGECGPKHEAAPPPADSHHQIVGHYLKMEPMCRCLGATSGSVDMTGDNEGKGVKTISQGGGGFYNDIWVGDVTITPKNTKYSTFLHWEGDCNGPEAEPIGPNGQIVLHMSRTYNYCRPIFDN